MVLTALAKFDSLGESLPGPSGGATAGGRVMSGRVLVVDDDQRMCELVAEGLGSRGYEVESRVSADEALALLDTADFDVVLTDLHLGGASGLELCERILARQADGCVVVLTAFGSLESAIGASRAGAY